MKRTIFDQIAPDYEAIHNQSLPPGVKSDDFVRYKALTIASLIMAGDHGGDFRYLDFGCGNGRLFRLLLDSPPLHNILSQGRLKLYGVDPSSQSLKEAAVIAGPQITLADNLRALPKEAAFDLIISCNVFHHIPPSERRDKLRELFARLRPGGKLVLWEHNPFNPFTRLLVKLCPFDGDARLLTMTSARRLCEEVGLRHLRHQYVHILPPALARYQLVDWLEQSLRRLPLGAQYWLMGNRDVR